MKRPMKEKKGRLKDRVAGAASFRWHVEHRHE